MEKRRMLRLEQEETDRKARPAAPGPDLQSQSPGDQELMSGVGSSSFEAEQQIGQKRRSDRRLQRNPQITEAQTLSDPRPPEPLSLWIHGLSVERYRDVYNSVLQPSVLAALSSCRHAEYVSQVLELKQRLWMVLSRPRLQETLMEDGRVEVKEIFDLTWDEM